MSVLAHHDDPRCGHDGRDPRDHGTRSWDALVELAQRGLDSQTLDRRPEFKPPPGRHRLVHGHDLEDCYHHDEHGWVRDRILRPPRD